MLQTKIKALVLSAVFTSIAGSLYSIKTGFIDPESGFGILVSVQMVIIAALGGAGTLFGPLVGALILIPLQTATNTWFGGGGSGLTFILYGGIIVLIARFEPGACSISGTGLRPRGGSGGGVVTLDHAAATTLLASRRAPSRDRRR